MFYTVFELDQQFMSYHRFDNHTKPKYQPYQTNQAKLDYPTLGGLCLVRAQ